MFASLSQEFISTMWACVCLPTTEPHPSQRLSHEVVYVSSVQACLLVNLILSSLDRISQHARWSMFTLRPNIQVIVLCDTVWAEIDRPLPVSLAHTSVNHEVASRSMAVVFFQTYAELLVCVSEVKFKFHFDAEMASLSLSQPFHRWWVEEIDVTLSCSLHFTQINLCRFSTKHPNNFSFHCFNLIINWNGAAR